jgi:hypothetical protein
MVLTEAFVLTVPHPTPELTEYVVSLHLRQLFEHSAVFLVMVFDPATFGMRVS